MATAPTTLMTADEFYKWANHEDNEDALYELDEGRVVDVPPPGEIHGIVCCLIGYLLSQYVFRRGRGYVCSNDTGLVLKRKPGTVRAPDLMLFDEKRSLDKLSRKFAKRVPKLVVEVLSPSDRPSRMNRRVSQYLKRRIPLVWLVDAEERKVTVYRPGKDLYVLEETEEVTGEDVLPGLRYKVAELFALPGE
jgi:Uma2 family endonuclease